MPKNVKKTIFPTLALPRSGFRVVNESPLSRYQLPVKYDTLILYSLIKKKGLICLN